jgi:class 3 adenylate cyclase
VLCSRTGAQGYLQGLSGSAAWAICKERGRKATASRTLGASDGSFWVIDHAVNRLPGLPADHRLWHVFGWADGLTTILFGMGDGVAKDGGTPSLMTVLFTDIVGSTEVTARRGDEDASAIRNIHDQLLRKQLTAHGGREVQTTGDGFLVTFSSVRKAIACACAIQRAQLEHNDRHPEQAVSLRVGLNAGEVSSRDDGLFGSAVNLAARVTAKAGPGEILVSEVVKQLAGKITGVDFRDRGRFRLRGFPDRWRLYQLVWSPDLAAAPPMLSAPQRTPWPRRHALAPPRSWDRGACRFP